MMNIIRSTMFSLKFFRIVDGNIAQKTRQTIRYCPLFYQHLREQQKKMNDNLKEYQRNKALEQSESLQYYKTLMSKYFQIRKRIVEKGKQSYDQIKDDNIRESVIKNLMKEGFEKLSLFYESLQNLVQGRRQVIQNEQFVFEDGKSVKQKRQNFQKLIERFFGKRPSKPQNKSDNQQQE